MTEIDEAQLLMRSDDDCTDDDNDDVTFSIFVGTQMHSRKFEY